MSLKFGDSAETIRQGLSQGTAIDGLIDCGQELKQRDACHTIALYFTECSDAGVPDFHFVKRNAHGWEDKTPMRDVRHYTDLPEDIDGYKLERYLLVPQGTKPHGLERLETETIIAISPGYGNIHFESATEKNLLGPMGTPANRIFLMFNEGIAMHTGAKLILPMPHCPEFIKPPKKPFDFLDFKEFPLKERDFSFYKSEPFSFK